MSDFEDANDSFDEADATYPLTGLRKRRPIWDGVLNEDLPGLDEVKVKFLSYLFKYRSRNF